MHVCIIGDKSLLTSARARGAPMPSPMGISPCVEVVRRPCTAAVYVELPCSLNGWDYNTTSTADYARGCGCQKRGWLLHQMTKCTTSRYALMCQYHSCVGSACKEQGRSRRRLQHATMSERGRLALPLNIAGQGRIRRRGLSKQKRVTRSAAPRCLPLLPGRT
jgi:hypothetical protein